MDSATQAQPVVCAWQVPSMLMLAIKASRKEAGDTPVYTYLHDFKEVRELLADSLSGIEAGRLPGDLGDTHEALDTGAGGKIHYDGGAGRGLQGLASCYCGCSVPVWRKPSSLVHTAQSVNLPLGFSVTQDVCSPAGCVERASCLLLYLDLIQHSGYLRLPWRKFCKEVPLQKMQNLIDHFLLLSGLMPLSQLHGGYTCLLNCSGSKPMSLWTNGHLCSDCSAEDAKYGPPTAKQSANAMVLALRVIRMIACVRGSGRFLRRGALVLRCVHLVRYVMAHIVRAAAPPIACMGMLA